MSAMKMLNTEVFVAEDRLVTVDCAQIKILKEQAARNPRRRVRLCAHKDVQDRLHEMLIVMGRDIYVRPHKHLRKTESFHVVEGTATVVFFEESGAIDEVVHIGDFLSGGVFYFRNDEPRYHTQIITSEFLVVHEITNGPFNRADTVFAPWAPDEADTAIVAGYLERLKRAIATS